MKIGYILNVFDPVTVGEYKQIKASLADYDLIYLVNKKSAKAILSLMIDDERIKIDDDFKLDLGEEIKLVSDVDKVKQGDFSLLSKEVREYIYQNGLYYDEIVRNHLKDYRYNHSVSVSKLCMEIAKAHHLDEHKAYLCGILHDVYKELDKNKSDLIMRKHFKELINEPYPLHHAYTATIFLKEKLLIDDEEIIDAVYNHTIGEDFKPLSKVLYVADKLDPLRGYAVEENLKLCLKDLDKGFAKVKAEQLEYIRKQGVNE